MPAKAVHAILCLVLCLPLTALAADPVQGKIIYQSTCVLCHNPTQRPIKTPPAKLADELYSRTFSAHHFILSDQDLDNLSAYLESSNGTRTPP